MNINYTIDKLKEQRLKVNFGDAEVWLKTTYAFIEDYFKSYSTRASSFQSLINSFSTKKIFGITAADINSFKKQALEYLNETIKYLEDQREIQLKAEAERQKILQQMRSKEKTNTEKREATVLPAPPISLPIIKTQLPFGIAPGLFWAILVALISGAYLLGRDFGSSKFDKEKSDYYDQVKSLRFDTSKLNQVIESKDSIIQERDYSLKKIRDSLASIKKEK